MRRNPSTVLSVLIAFVIGAMLGGCAVCRAGGNEPNYENVVKHNILSSTESFDPQRVAKKAKSLYVPITSQKDISTIKVKNALYAIKTEINLQGKTLTVPSGCLLFFDGGSFRNGTIVGNNTVVVARDYEVFKHGVRKFRAYGTDSYKYVTREQDAIVIKGTWKNTLCGHQWTGMLMQDNNHCAGLAINNFINLHKKGTEIVFPFGHEYYVYDRIVCSGYSVDFNNSVIRSIDFDKVEDKTIALPDGSKARALKSLYGLIDFNGNNAYLKNITIDGRASKRNEVPSLGTECLISMGSNANCKIQNVTLVDAVGCGICTYTITNCTFDSLVINGCGEHGIYTHAYKGAVAFNNCHFVNCGQDVALYKQRGQSACVKFSGARDQGFFALKDLRAYFTDCSFERDGKFEVATTYSDIPYAEFNRCKWEGVKGYSIATPKLAEGIGRLVEFKFIECDNPCYRIQSVNVIRRLIRCTNVSNPFADAVELTDCEISVGYADVENNYSDMFRTQYTVPLVCSNCRFVKGSDDTPIRNTIRKPRPMVFNRCQWSFKPSTAKQYKGSYFIIMTNPEVAASKHVSFNDCQIDIDKYRLLYCSDADVSFKDCSYLSSYESLVDGTPEKPNRVSVKNMTQKGKKQVARHYIPVK